MKQASKSIALAVTAGMTSIGINVFISNDVTTTTGAIALAAWGVATALSCVGVARYADQSKYEPNLTGDYLDLIGDFAGVKRRFAGWEFCSKYRRRVLAALEQHYICKPGSLGFEFCDMGDSYYIHVNETSDSGDRSLFDLAGNDILRYMHMQDIPATMRSYNLDTHRKPEQYRK